MPERFRVTFEQPPFGYVIRKMIGESSFVDDVRKLATISEEQVANVADKLAGIKFADKKTFNQILSDADVSDADDVAGTLYRLGSMVRESSTSKASAQEAFIDALKQTDVEEKEQAKITNVFDTLCIKPHSFDLQKKAERLAQSTGCKVESLGIVCDIRPIFDSDHKAIVGTLPHFVLRAEYDDGESQLVDLRLSDSQLDELKVEVEKAIKKRDVLLETLNKETSWEIPRVEQ